MVNSGDKHECMAPSDHDELIKQIDTLSMAVYQKENEINELESRLNQKEETINILQGDIALRDEEIQRLNGKINNWKARMDEKLEVERVYREKGTKCFNDLKSLKDRMEKQTEQVKLLQSQLKGERAP